MKSLSAQKTVAFAVIFALLICAIIIAMPAKVASAEEPETPQAIIKTLSGDELNITAFQSGSSPDSAKDYTLAFGLSIATEDTESDYDDWGVDFVFTVESGAVDPTKLYAAGQYDNYKEDYWVYFNIAGANGGKPWVMGDKISLNEEWAGPLVYSDVYQLVQKFQCGLIDISEDQSAFAPGTTLSFEVQLCEYDGDEKTGNYISTGETSIDVVEDIDKLDWPKIESSELTGDELNVTLVDDSTLTLDYGYKFSAKDETADGKIYAGWNVDFLLNVESGALYSDKIVLAGQYASYGDKWVALPLNEVIDESKLEEGDSIRILKAAGMDNVTYADVVNLVKTFQCGLKDVSTDGTGADEGTTLSVEIVMYKVFGGEELNEMYSIDKEECEVQPEEEKVEISSIEVNKDGELVIKYSDGTEQNLGKIAGEKGEKGDRGAAGVDGVDGANGDNAKALSIVAIVISAIAVIIMLYVAIVVTTKLKRR